MPLSDFTSGVEGFIPIPHTLPLLACSDYGCGGICDSWCSALVTDSTVCGFVCAHRLPVVIWCWTTSSPRKHRWWPSWKMPRIWRRWKGL